MTSPKKSLLFTPLTVRGVTFKNRVGVPPMAMGSAERGFPTNFHLVHYGSFATGGAGMVIVEATAVEERGRVTNGCLGIWKDEYIEPLANISRFIKDYGSVPGIQLGHAGRKGSMKTPAQGRGTLEDEEGGWALIGPSPVAFGEDSHRIPKEATLEDINHIRQAFVDGAKRAVKAGFELIELHFAHGYLVSSFLSPVSNHRRGKYGGNLENRMRLALEITEDVRKAVPNAVLAVRISITDYTENGWNINDTLELAKRLKALDVDLVDCSSGGVTAIKNMVLLNSGGIQRDAAKRVQQEVGIATCAVGQVVDPFKAEEILEKNEATFVLLGRMFLNNPHWTFLAADLLDGERSFKYPIQYEWCIGWQAFGKWRKFLQDDEKKV